MPTTQEATSDPTDELIALLVPKRHTHASTVVACLGVVVVLAGFTVVRSTGVVVPHLRAEVSSSAVAPDGAVTGVMRVFNDGATSARLDGVDADEVGLSRPVIVTHLPLTIPAGAHRDVTMRWARHECLAVTHGEAAKFTIRARTWLPFSIAHGYPYRRSDTFSARVDPAPLPGAPGDQASANGGYGGWVMQVLGFACAYGR